MVANWDSNCVINDLNSNDSILQVMKMFHENGMEYLFEILKSMVVQNEMDDIRAKLRETLSYRANKLKDIDINLQEFFPYFFMNC